MARSKESIPDEIKAMGFSEPKSEVKLIKYKTKPVGQFDVDIRVNYNGICHTDIHMIDNDWGMSRYPLVPGHEIVGRVIGVGSAITNIKEGESVCLGVVCQTCMTCSYCKCGNDNLCLKREFTYFGNPTDETGSHPHHGGFGSYMRTDGRKLLKVPDGLEERYVGPLMCAGITVWEPLVNYLQGTDGKGKTIGVVGIGGLGHLAVKFAHKMGANVVAFSRGSRKDQLAKDLGASSFVDTTSDDAMKAAEETKFDQLIITIAGGKIDLDKWFPLMNREGNIHFCGIPDESLTFNMMPLILGRLSITGNPVGGRKDTREMLHYAAKHHITPIIEEFPHSKADKAIKKLRDGNIRFRAVLRNDLD